MWTFKNVLALGLFLFGSTFLWMTASFAGRVPPPTGIAWTLVNGLALAAVAGFTIAGWAVFKEYSWWNTAALLSAAVGLIAVVPFVMGLVQIRAAFSDLGIQINLWMHAIGSLVIIGVVLSPAARDWITQRV
jgi:hypothetical protein